MRSMLPDARRTAASYLIAAGRADDANTVLAGNGDDYVEVRVALQALTETALRVGRAERALATYADQTFWEADCAEASLAFYDQGEIARSALAGKELYALHRV